MFFMFLNIMGFTQTVTPPANLKAVMAGPTAIGMHAVALTWDYSQTTAEFNIYKRIGALTDTTPFQKVGTTIHTTFIDPVMEGKTFSYYVTAVVNKVESDPSNSVEITVVPPVIAFGKISGNLFDDVSNAGIRGNISFISTLGMPTAAVDFGMSVMTDSNGNFSTRLRAGDYFIFSSAHGYFGEFYDNVKTIQNATKVTVNAGDSLVFSIGLAKLVPPVTYSVSGWVKDGSGNPLKAELTAFIANKPHDPSCWDMSYPSRTDSLGNYTIKGVRPGDTIVVYAVPMDRAYLPQYYNGKTTFSDADKIGVTGNVTDINFTLTAKTVLNNGISGTVMDSAGTTIVKGSVFIFKKDNLKNIFGFRHRAQIDTLTGIYSFTNLEPGQYLVLAEGRGYIPSFFRYDGTTTLDPRKADSVVVTETSLVTGINFNLRSHAVHVGGGFVFGIVRGNDGATLPGTVNYILNSTGDFIDYSASDLDGSYMISSVEAGSYTMVSALASFESAQNTLSVDYASNSSLDVDISLSPNSTTGVNNKIAVVSGFELKQNYPNPFNPSTTITYQIPQNSFVTLKVYNILGNEVATLVNGQQAAGVYNFNFKANNLASGIYIYKLTAGNFTSVRKLTLLK
jgi:hypothetical protein